MLFIAGDLGYLVAIGFEQNTATYSAVRADGSDGF
jgi:hypothetical protein